MACWEYSAPTSLKPRLMSTRKTDRQHATWKVNVLTSPVVRWEVEIVGLQEPMIDLLLRLNGLGFPKHIWSYGKRKPLKSAQTLANRGLTHNSSHFHKPLIVIDVITPILHMFRISPTIQSFYPSFP